MTAASRRWLNRRRFISARWLFGAIATLVLCVAIAAPAAAHRAWPRAHEAYTYDPAGNRLPADLQLQAAWSYNSDNELISTDSASYAYDDAGNRISETTASAQTAYVYDERSQLVRVERPPGPGNAIASYGYDPFSRRVWKDAGGNRTYFFYAHNGLVAELDSAGQVQRSFGYEPTSEWMTTPLFLRDGGYSHFHNGHLGEPQKLTNAAGGTVWSAKYSAYGSAEINTQVVANPLRLPGQYHDQETGLHYNLRRYYSAEIGRYLTADPIGLAGGLNLYAYAHSSPLSYYDATGECADVLIDAAFIAHDLNELRKNPCDIDNQIALGLNVLGAGIPFVSGLGTAYRAGRHGDKLGIARETARKLLNPPINIPPDRLNHVVDRHAVIGRYANKSKFNAGEDIAGLIQSQAQQPMLRQNNGNFARICDVGRNIGVDRATGRQTTVMTVITSPNNDLVTAFPGLPIK